MKACAVSGFIGEAFATWVSANPPPGSDICSDGLACFAGVIDAGCVHTYIVIGKRKPPKKLVILFA